MRQPRRNNDDDNFPGLSQREQAEISGKALGGHIFSQIENALTGEEGGFRQAFVNDAWEDAANHWSGHDIREDSDDDGYPYVHFQNPAIPAIHGRYPINGQYLDIHYHGNPVETLHIDKEDRKNPAEVSRRFNEWISEDFPTRDPRDW